MKQKHETLIQDLLTEDRYWLFWKSDWSKMLTIRWNGKTKFSTIIAEMKKELGKDMIYERQVEIREPNFTFK